ncbi:MAG: hypothetical protein WB988_22545, partial [Candidatus Nitrosopolaris sp.]
MRRHIAGKDGNVSKYDSKTTGRNKDNDGDSEQKDKIRLATAGMQRECYNKLLRLERGNATILAEYLLTYKREVDIADSTRATALLN